MLKIAVGKILYLTGIALAMVLIISDNGKCLDFSRLPYDSSEIALIKQYLPDEFEHSLESLKIGPKLLEMYIGTRYFYKNQKDSTPSAFLLYYTDGISKGLLIALSVDDEKPKLIAQTDKVNGHSDMTVAMIDIDCDKSNEILASTYTDMNNYQAIDIIRLIDGKFHFLSPTDDNNRFIGRLFDINDIDGDCVKETMVILDGPTGNQFGARKLYRYNSETQKYELESIEN
jgi:hypothetical protein